MTIWQCKIQKPIWYINNPIWAFVRCSRKHKRTEKDWLWGSTWRLGSVEETKEQPRSTRLISVGPSLTIKSAKTLVAQYADTFSGPSTPQPWFSARTDGLAQNARSSSSIVPTLGVKTQSNCAEDICKTSWVQEKMDFEQIKKSKARVCKSFIHVINWWHWLLIAVYRLRRQSLSLLTFILSGRVKNKSSEFAKVRNVCIYIGGTVSTLDTTSKSDVLETGEWL